MYNAFFFIITTRCTNFPNLFWHATQHVSGSSSVHYLVCVCVCFFKLFIYNMLHYKVILHVLVFMLLTTNSIWMLFNNITQVLYFALFAPPVEFFVSLAGLVQFLKVN